MAPSGTVSSAPARWRRTRKGTQARPAAFVLYYRAGSMLQCQSTPWRYRLTVRTEPSQGLNTGSIPVSATKYFIINQLRKRRTQLMYKRYNELGGNSHVNPLSA